MTHTRQHGGWALQAKRRGESYELCGTCGQRKHPRPYRQAEAERDEGWFEVVTAFVVLVMLVAAFWSLSIIAAAVTA